MNRTENLVFTSVDVDTLVEKIAEKVIDIMLFHGNQEKRKKFFEINDFLKTPIYKLDFSVRTYNCFKANDIRTLEDLIQRSERDLIKIRNFGKKGLLEVITFLDEHGLSLKVEQK
jgi:DNA-directed RNA polymerase alpha subunit